MTFLLKWNIRVRRVDETYDFLTNIHSVSRLVYYLVHFKVFLLVKQSYSGIGYLPAPRLNLLKPTYTMRRLIALHVFKNSSTLRRQVK